MKRLNGLRRGVAITSICPQCTTHAGLYGPHGVVLGGVEDGIERWSRRLMPLLIVTLIALSGYVLTLEGALAGLEVYLLPDFSKLLSEAY